MSPRGKTSTAAASRAESWPGELNGEAGQLLAERLDALSELARAVEAVPEPSLVESLARVAAKLPRAVNVEVVTIRVRESDGAKGFRLLGAVGLPTMDRRRLSLRPMSLARTRTVLALGARHDHPRRLGLRWLYGLWLGDADDVIGSILVGSRTERRPTESDLAVLEATAADLGAKLSKVDRSSSALRSASATVARNLLEAHMPVPKEGPLTVLRKRELGVLELYADGLTTREIAETLVLSEHTVRTHVKNALGRLSVHSRDEAVELVRAERVVKLF